MIARLFGVQTHSQRCSVMLSKPDSSASFIGSNYLRVVMNLALFDPRHRFRPNLLQPAIRECLQRRNKPRLAFIAVACQKAPQRFALQPAKLTRIVHIAISQIFQTDFQLNPYIL